MKSIVLEKSTPLTSKDKRLFGYFGENVKIKPPFRILNPQHIYIGDFISIREHAYIHAYTDLTELHDFIDKRYKKDIPRELYRYQPKIEIDREVKIGRFLLISCTNHIKLCRNAFCSERVFIGDNNHSFSHPEVPIMQQPNKKGTPVEIGPGSWIGIGAAILPGTKLGKNNVVRANAVVQGQFPDHAVIGTDMAKLLFLKDHEK